MKILGILSLLLLSVNVQAQVVFKTVKADGTVVYSDVKTPGSTPVNLSAVNSAVIPQMSNKAKNKAVSAKQTKLAKNTPQYSVTIMSPAPEQTIRNNAGKVNISSQVTPKKAGKFELMLNNSKVKTQSQGVFSLESLDRGAYTYQVNFLDNSGKILASSKPQTFYLHQASALIKAN